MRLVKTKIWKILEKDLKKKKITEKLNNKKGIYKIVAEFVLNKKKKRKEKGGWNSIRNSFQVKKEEQR